MPITVRDGQKVWPTCPECGCRLRKLSGFLLAHFYNDNKEDYDARGCKCSKVYEVYDMIALSTKGWEILISK